MHITSMVRGCPGVISAARDVFCSTFACANGADVDALRCETNSSGVAGLLFDVCAAPAIFLFSARELAFEPSCSLLTSLCALDFGSGS
eukprot:3067673-Pleurochrysis_carterae.AAC.1